MALSKIQSESINLADTFAFTGTVSGVGGLVKLFTQSSSSTVTSIDITDTYINTTYDSYYILGHVLPVSDNVQIHLKLKDASGIITGNLHGYDTQYLALGDESQGGTHIRLNYSNVGNAAGEGAQFSFHMYHVNSTTVPCTCIGGAKTAFTNGNPEGIYFTGGMIASQYAKIIKGFNISANSGSIASHNITIYGITK